MKYEYSIKDNLAEPLKYQYTAYRGKAFMRDWYVSRKTALADFDRVTYSAADIPCTHPSASQSPNQGESGKIYMEPLLNKILESLFDDTPGCAQCRDELDRCVKAFEIRKRLYPVYTSRFKPEEGSYREIRLYAAFACVCAVAFHRFQDFRYLNALLKVDDTILSQWNQVLSLEDERVKLQIGYALWAELEIVAAVCRENGIDMGSVKDEAT